MNLKLSEKEKSYSEMAKYKAMRIAEILNRIDRHYSVTLNDILGKATEKEIDFYYKILMR